MVHKCDKCNKEFKTLLSFSRHFTQKHRDINYIEYMTDRMSIERNAFCEECGCHIQHYYGHTPSFCSGSCRARFVRRDRKTNNPEKELIFRRKISKAIKKEWEEKDQTQRIMNISKTIKDITSKMSLEERKNKFGHINKLSNEHRLIFIEKMKTVGAHRWWNEASENEKIKVYNKRQTTKQNWTDQRRLEVGDKISKSLDKTWNTRGNEILKKQIETRCKNNKNKNTLSFSEKDMQKMNSSLCELLNMENNVEDISYS